MAFYEESGGPEKTDFFRGTGCNFCSGTGYKDRIGVYELLAHDPRDQATGRRLGDPGRAAQTGTKTRDATLRQEAIDLVAQDITTVSEVIRSIYTLVR